MTQVTFEDLLEHYFFSKSLRPDTEWSYKKVVISFQKYTTKPPNEITHTMILEWRRKVLKEEKLQPRTWNNKVAHLGAIFNFAIKTKLIQHTENPLNGTIVRPEIKKKKVLTRAQMETVFRTMEQFCEYERVQSDSANFNGRPNACLPAWFRLTILHIFRYTGIRQNQIMNIRLCDVNLEERWIKLPVESAKNHREHCVPIVSSLYPHLEILLHRACEAGAKPDDQLINIGLYDSLRCEKYKAGMDIYPLRAFFKRLSDECGFWVTPHRFRHTVATHMMKSPDRNLQAVKKLLGHVSIQSTLEYIDESVDSLRDILETELM